MRQGLLSSPTITGYFVWTCQLSHRYQHHLFDTLYHAVAINSPHTQLITADEKYYRKSYKEGAIIRLSDLMLSYCKKKSRRFPPGFSNSDQEADTLPKLSMCQA